MTFIYFTISILLWLTWFQTNLLIRKTVRTLRLIIFGTGYLMATVGFLFVIIASFELQTDQRKWLTEDLIYKERNIGSGPDPSVRLKEIEVYKTIKWLPLFANRIKTKTYDTWYVPLKHKLHVTYSQDNQTLYLASVINGYKVFNWSDTIVLNKNPYR